MQLVGSTPHSLSRALTATRLQGVTELSVLLARAESIWGSIDDLFSHFDETQWAKPHGKDWTFADVPFHLGYFDREMIAERIGTAGDDLPVFQTMADLDAWNDEHFATRSGSAVEVALGQMRAGRAAVRDAVASADAGASAFVSLPGLGATTIEVALTSLVTHTWNHFIEAQVRSGVDIRAERDVTALAIRSNLGFMPVGLDRAAAQTSELTVCFDVGGVGAYTVEVTDGECHVDDGAPADADLTMRFPDERAFGSMFHGIKNPMVMMFTRQMRVKGLGKMGAFGKLFPQPAPDTVLGPPGSFSLAS